MEQPRPFRCTRSFDDMKATWVKRGRLCRDFALLLLIAAVPALLSGIFHPKHPEWRWSKPSVAEVELADVDRWAQPVLWIDARATEAYQREHIPGAVLINESNWERSLPDFLVKWQPGTKIIVYCDSQACDASQVIALRLQRELNLTDVHVLKGGWATWLKNRP